MSLRLSALLQRFMTQAQRASVKPWKIYQNTTQKCKITVCRTLWKIFTDSNRSKLKRKNLHMQLFCFWFNFSGTFLNLRQKTISKRSTKRHLEKILCWWMQCSLSLCSNHQALSILCSDFSLKSSKLQFIYLMLNKTNYKSNMQTKLWPSWHLCTNQLDSLLLATFTQSHKVRQSLFNNYARNEQTSWVGTRLSSSKASLC